MPVSTATNTTNGQLAPSTITTTFNENHENLHHIEFEAPPSGELDLEHRLQIAQNLAQNGRFSIDLSLELERQLNMESPPVTPSYDLSTQAATTKDIHSQEHHSKPDPDVLAHIVTHMRKSLAETSKERDELVRMLAEANTQTANTKDALQLMTEKASGAKEELDAARRKMREDEEQIVLLRAKVEESRRGLMRLQTESKRQSLVLADSTRTSSLTLAAFGSPPPSKRASFTPLTGRPGHKRISSVSDANFNSSFLTPEHSPSPQAQTFNMTSPEPHSSSPQSSSRRLSGMFGHQSPPASDLLTTTVTEPPQVPVSSASVAVAAVNSEELETLRKELQSVKAELATMKHDLIEANEAKEASETCVKALREFIADNNVGAVNADDASSSLSVPIKLPPPPTMVTDEEEPDRGKSNGGWGFKLWGVDSPMKSGMPFSASGATPSPIGPVNSTSTLPLPPVIAAAPLSRKLGGFFSSRSSLSSNSSQQQPSAPPLQTNAAGMQLPLPSYRDSVSDTSSMAEPISPGSDIHGLGTGPAGYFPEAQGGYGSIVVKDVTNLDRVHTHALSVDDKDGIVRYEPPLTLSSSGSADPDGLR